MNDPTFCVQVIQTLKNLETEGKKPLEKAKNKQTEQNENAKLPKMTNKPEGLLCLITVQIRAIVISV